jgi:hypothetical protein
MTKGGQWKNSPKRTITEKGAKSLAERIEKRGAKAKVVKKGKSYRVKYRLP